MADKSIKIGMLGNVIHKQVVKEKQSSLVATVSVMESDGMLNDVTPTVEKEKQSSLEDTTGLGSFPPLPIQVNTSAGNALGKSSYANAAGKPSGKKLNIRTLFTPRGNGIDVVVPVDSIRAVSEQFANSAYGFFLGKKVAYPVVANYHPDKNLLKEDVSTVPVWVKLYGVPVTAFSNDGLSAIATKLGTPLMLHSFTSDMYM
ncbi:Rop guanine nucleotide exchange factor 5 [Tanacetum coccineum]